jgi:hypothetical protein
MFVCLCICEHLSKDYLRRSYVFVCVKFACVCLPRNSLYLVSIPSAGLYFSYQYSREDASCNKYSSLVSTTSGPFSLTRVQHTPYSISSGLRVDLIRPEGVLELLLIMYLQL